MQPYQKSFICPSHMVEDILGVGAKGETNYLTLIKGTSD